MYIRCLIIVLFIYSTFSFNLNNKLSHHTNFLTKSTSDKESYHSNIRLLRISTGLGTSKCAEALKKTGNDVNKALALLKNVETGTKPSSEGLIPLYEGVSTTSIGKNFASIIELRCDSGFVSCNSMFGNLAASIASAITSLAEANGKQIDFQEVFNQKCLACGQTLAETSNYVKRSLKEPLLITRFGIISKGDNTYFSTYSHKTNQSCSGPVGPSASLISYTTNIPIEAEEYELKPGTHCITRDERCFYHKEYKSPIGSSHFAYEIAMHIVAASPTAMSFEDLGESYNEAKSKLVEEMSNTGKPPDLIDKIVQGRLRKQFAEFLLLEQDWSMDNCTTRQAIDKYNKKTNDIFKVLSFIVFNVKDDMLSIVNKSEELREITSINYKL